MNATIVSETDWLNARRALLAEEKALTTERDRLAEKRRSLPWVRVHKPYRFVGPSGPETLGDLFAGRPQLMIYHFMFGAEAQAGCPTCSLIADSYERLVVHLAARHVTLVTVSRAPIDRLAAFKARMGWTFKWMSSLGSDFNQDYKVTFTPEELEAASPPYNHGTSHFPMEECPGLSVFAKGQDGAVFHTYSTYSRGLDQLIGVYPLLDLAPFGRDENDLPMSMAWIRHRDAYAEADQP